VYEAKRVGIYTIALCDHDSISGVEEALAVGNQLGIEVISGVELSVEGFTEEKIHLLGYGFDFHNVDLIRALESMCDKRKKRMELMIKKLNSSGLFVSESDLPPVKEGQSLGRPHLAQALVNKGYAYGVQEAFDKYLSIGKVAYVPKARLSAIEGINLIHQAGGLAVCAHPGLIGSLRELERLIKLGIDGIEVVHSDHDQKQEEYFWKLALLHNLIPTGGSDFHGPQVKEGINIGGKNIPADWVERLKANYYKLPLNKPRS
jgi:predicted metal-dependent phosphoesterase TrpH